MPRIILVLLLSTLLYAATMPSAEARRGCCSHHGGVCECQCCDGTPLSEKCAPYYPKCNAETKSKTKARNQHKQPKKSDGTVVRVLDGDTLEVMRDGKPVRVRLTGIDCPEKGQPFGMTAKKAVIKMVKGQSVTIIENGRGRYGRVLGEIILPDRRSLNLELVRLGLAWWYRKYSPDDSTLKKLEWEARNAKRGLWKDKEPVPPWEWRKGKH